MAIAGVVTWVVISSTLADQRITVSDDANCAAGDDVNGPSRRSAKRTSSTTTRRTSPVERPMRNSRKTTRTAPLRWIPRSSKPPLFTSLLPSESLAWRSSWDRPYSDRLGPAGTRSRGSHHHHVVPRGAAEVEPNSRSRRTAMHRTPADRGNGCAHGGRGRPCLAPDPGNSSTLMNPGTWTHVVPLALADTDDTARPEHQDCNRRAVVDTREQIKPPELRRFATTGRPSTAPMCRPALQSRISLPTSHARRTRWPRQFPPGPCWPVPRIVSRHRGWSPERPVVAFGVADVSAAATVVLVGHRAIDDRAGGDRPVKHRVRVVDDQVAGCLTRWCDRRSLAVGAAHDPAAAPHPLAVHDDGRMASSRYVPCSWNPIAASQAPIASVSRKLMVCQCLMSVMSMTSAWWVRDVLVLDGWELPALPFGRAAPGQRDPLPRQVGLVGVPASRGDRGERHALAHQRVAAREACQPLPLLRGHAGLSPARARRGGRRLSPTSSATWATPRAPRQPGQGAADLGSWAPGRRPGPAHRQGFARPGRPSQVRRPIRPAGRGGVAQGGVDLGRLDEDTSEARRRYPEQQHGLPQR